MKDPGCYSCVHRREALGSAHSKCAHPSVPEKFRDDLLGLAALLTPEGLSTALELGIKASAHGIHNGWFCWPANFDPVWLEACDGFTPAPVKA